MNVKNLIFAAIAVLGLAACEEEAPGFEGTAVYFINEPEPITVNWTPKEERSFSDCFSTTVTYRNDQGKIVTEENIKLPWKKEFTVKAPFNLKMEYSHALLPALAGKPDDYIFCAYKGDISQMLLVRPGESNVCKYWIYSHTNYFYQSAYYSISDYESFLNGEYRRYSHEWNFTEEVWGLNSAQLYRYCSDRY
jgi:hypothetical protein